MISRAHYLTGGFLFAGVLVLGYGILSVQKGTSELPEAVLRDLAEIDVRLDNMQQSISQLAKVQRGTPSTPLKASKAGDIDQVALPIALDERLQSIETELLALWEIAGPELRPEAIEDQSDGVADILDSHTPSDIRTVSSRFEEDGKKTAWSEATESAINQGFSAGSFTAVQRGDLQTDCRRSICKLEWFIVDADDLSPEQEDMMLSTARLELVGLAGQSASLVGRTHAEFNLRGDRPSLAVYIERKENESSQSQIRWSE
jgi:hypothetical protein